MVSIDASGQQRRLDDTPSLRLGSPFASQARPLGPAARWCKLPALRD